MTPNEFFELLRTYESKVAAGKHEAANLLRESIGKAFVDAQATVYAECADVARTTETSDIEWIDGRPNAYPVIGGKYVAVEIEKRKRQRLDMPTSNVNDASRFFDVLAIYEAEKPMRYAIAQMTRFMIDLGNNGEKYNSTIDAITAKKPQIFEKPLDFLWRLNNLKPIPPATRATIINYVARIVDRDIEIHQQLSGKVAHYTRLIFARHDSEKSLRDILGLPSPTNPFEHFALAALDAAMGDVSPALPAFRQNRLKAERFAVSQSFDVNANPFTSTEDAVQRIAEFVRAGVGRESFESEIKLIAEFSKLISRHCKDLGLINTGRFDPLLRKADGKVAGLRDPLPPPVSFARPRLR